MHSGGAAHAQYRLCARITERLPKILKMFTRYTDSTVNGLGALRLLRVHCIGSLKLPANLRGVNLRDALRSLVFHIIHYLRYRVPSE